jgi:hypothetical protein
MSRRQTVEMKDVWTHDLPRLQDHATAAPIRGHRGGLGSPCSKVPSTLRVQRISLPPAPSLFVVAGAGEPTPAFPRNDGVRGSSPRVGSRVRAVSGVLDSVGATGQVCMSRLSGSGTLVECLSLREAPSGASRSCGAAPRPAQRLLGSSDERSNWTL